MRTTQKELEGLVKRLNMLTGNATTYRTRHADGGYTTHIGHYRLDYAYGGVKLVQTMNGVGGIRTITNGYETKSNCYQQIDRYIRGIEDCVRDEKTLDAAIHIIPGRK